MDRSSTERSTRQRFKKAVERIQCGSYKIGKKDRWCLSAEHLEVTRLVTF